MEETNNTSIKILMTTDTIGGVWTYCMELCSALKLFNMEVHLVTAGAKMSFWQKQEVELLDNVVVYETSFVLEWMRDPWQNIDESGKWLLQLADTIQPDLVHLNCYSYASLPWKVPCIVVAHSDVYSWFVSVQQQAPPMEWSEYINRVKTGLLAADLVIAPSHSVLRSIQQLYAPVKKAKVIYNGRSKSLFYTADKEPYIFTMGRVWDEGKNIQLLINSAPHIPHTIRVAGDNVFEQDSISFQHANTLYLGKLKTADIAKQLSAAAVYVLPAKYEPFGLSALEAALSGCALVLGDIESLREVWEDNAVYVDTNNPRTLARAINQLMGNKSLLEHYAAKANRHAQHFTALQMGSRYFSQYRALLQHLHPKKTSLA